MNTSKKSLHTLMRGLHRDVGALTVGLTLIFCFTGLVFIYRDIGLLKQETVIKKSFSQNLNATELQEALDFSKLTVIEENKQHIKFQNGTYNKNTGIATYTQKGYPKLIKKLNAIHKTKSGNRLHIISLIYTLLLFFLALSSFWMYKPGSSPFKRYISFTGIGASLALFFLLLT